MNGFRNQRGSVSIWALLITSGGFAVLLGLVVDGGQLIDARLEASRVAAQAARVGADQLSGSSVRSGSAVVSAQAAVVRVNSYLADAGQSGSVKVTGDRVTVTITGSSPASILSIIGIDSFPIEESATAQGITGQGSP